MGFEDRALAGWGEAGRAALRYLLSFLSSWNLEGVIVENAKNRNWLWHNTQPWLSTKPISFISAISNQAMVPKYGS